MYKPFVIKTDKKRKRDGQERIILKLVGTSKIYYKVTKTETGFVANFLKENIAFTHGIFRIDVEKQLVEMMRRFGAEVE